VKSRSARKVRRKYEDITVPNRESIHTVVNKLRQEYHY
jgi:hypothetical protein